MIKYDEMLVGEEIENEHAYNIVIKLYFLKNEKYTIHKEIFRAQLLLQEILRTVQNEADNNYTKLRTNNALILSRFTNIFTQKRSVSEIMMLVSALIYPLGEEQIYLLYQLN